MPKPRNKTTKWKQYNRALINRGSLTFWIDEEAILKSKQSKQGKRGRPHQFSDLAIITALMVKRALSMPLRALQEVSIQYFHWLTSTLQLYQSKS